MRFLASEKTQLSEWQATVNSLDWLTCRKSYRKANLKNHSYSNVMKPRSMILEANEERRLSKSRKVKRVLNTV